MTTKLTLTVEKDTIERAKQYARNTGRSLSELIGSYLETLTATDNKDTENLSPKLKSLIGVVKLPDDFSEDADLNAYFESKHL